MTVPFLDLKTQYLSLRSEIDSALHQVLDRTAFAGGPFVETFESEFAAFCRCRHAVGVGSGTEALWLTLLALGLGPGDEVITVPSTFIATTEAISFAGAKPVFVDIDEQTYTMDPEKLSEYLWSRSHDGSSQSRVKAVIPVHLFGQTADMDPIRDIAAEYGLFIVEDACQAHGSEYKGWTAGSLGVAGCFSFYPGKNLGAYGEAGAVVTNDSEVAEKVKRLRDHGQSQKYLHGAIGWNSRMDGFQAAILSVKLRHLPEWNRARRKNATCYSDLLSDCANGSLILPVEADYAKHVYHLYVIRVRRRELLMRALSEAGISSGIHYPVPIHLTEAYQFLGYHRGSFPVAERCADEFVSLPMFPELTRAQIEYVAENISRFVADNDRITDESVRSELAASRNSA
nr:DegT/DnrJ/EryC1/StrS family aminotransferase [Deltaproteobacteria bacterium]